MRERAPGVKFALFTVVCAIAAAYIATVTGNVSVRDLVPFLPSSRVAYEAELDAADGLFIGDQVRLSGVPVGKVDGIALQRGRAIVSFSVEQDVEITDAWEVGARWRNVIGQRYLYLYQAPGGTPLAEGDRVPVERSRPVADISRFFGTVTPLLEAIDPEQQNKLLGALNTAIDGRQAELQQLASDLGSFGNTIGDNEASIRNVLRDGNTILAEFNRRDEELSSLITDFADVGTVLANRNDELLASIRDIAEVQREFGALLGDNDAEIRGLVTNLEQLTASIGRNRGAFEASVETARDGLAVYNLISRWGQWFNVRVVAGQVQIGGQLACITEAGATCSEPNSAANDPEVSSAAPTPSETRVSALGVVADAGLLGADGTETADATPAGAAPARAVTVGGR